jgi:hypothetical protein
MPTVQLLHNGEHLTGGKNSGMLPHLFLRNYMQALQVGQNHNAPLIPTVSLFNTEKN